MNLNKASDWISNFNIRQHIKPIHAVLLLALAIRIYAAIVRGIINPDGAQYIYQASGLFNWELSSLVSCKLPFFSPLPIFIAAAFAICRDWIVAGQIINVLFGWATLLPLYYILRRIFDQHVSTLTVLVFALIPVLVDGSSNVLRGPMFWFCICSGMLCFLRQWDQETNEGRFRYDLLASVTLFIFATWMRIEGVIFLVMPVVYLCFAQTDRKFQRCSFFMLPLMALGLAVFGVALASGTEVISILRFHQVFDEATQFVSNYQALDKWIGSIQAQHGGFYSEFLKRSREMLSLIPLTVIGYSVLEGVFYPFALILFLGLFGIREKCRQNRRTAYFLLQTLGGLALLYIHIIQTWIFAYRFLAIMVFPACVLMANGIEKIILYLQIRRQWNPGKAAGVVAAVLIVVALPKNMKPEEDDKMVYRQVARIMAQQAVSGQPIRVAGIKRTRALEWISLYSHRNASDIPCSQDLTGAFSSDYRQFVSNLDLAGIRYLFYEERFWPHAALDLEASPYHKDFRLLGRWKHPDSKKFMLFERLTH